MQCPFKHSSGQTQRAGSIRGRRRRPHQFRISRFLHLSADASAQKRGQGQQHYSGGSKRRRLALSLPFLRASFPPSQSRTPFPAPFPSLPSLLFQQFQLLMQPDARTAARRKEEEGLSTAAAVYKFFRLRRRTSSLSPTSCAFFPGPGRRSAGSVVPLQRHSRGD